jgi:hypothetical protein
MLTRQVACPLKGKASDISVVVIQIIYHKFAKYQRIRQFVTRDEQFPIDTKRLKPRIQANDAPFSQYLDTIHCNIALDSTIRN